jgi:hypothetical protein
MEVIIMANEQKLTQEELEAKLKRLEELEAANAAQSGAAGSGDNSGEDKPDGDKKSFMDKAKDKAKGFWTLDLGLTPGKIVLAAVGIPAAILGIKAVYNKGVEAGKSEAELCALPDNDVEPQLALETTEPSVEATVDDYATEEVCEEE